MNYTRPQLTILGDATKFIAITGFKAGCASGAQNRRRWIPVACLRSWRV